MLPQSNKDMIEHDRTKTVISYQLGETSKHFLSNLKQENNFIFPILNSILETLLRIIREQKEIKGIETGNRNLKYPCLHIAC